MGDTWGRLGLDLIMKLLLKPHPWVTQFLNGSFLWTPDLGSSVLTLSQFGNPSLWNHRTIKPN